MIRRYRLMRAGLVWATGRAIAKAMRMAKEQTRLCGVPVTVTLRLSGPMHLFRTKTYEFTGSNVCDHRI